MASINISKVVFKKIAQVQETTELDVYRRFLDHITDFRLDVGILSRSMITDLYGNDDKNPKYFDYRNHCNWAALANGVLDEDETLCLYQKKKGGLVKIFDNSIFRKLFHSTKKRSTTCTKHIFVISKVGKQLNISYTTNANNTEVFPYGSEHNFVAGKVVKSKFIGKVVNEVIEQVCDSTTTKLPEECTFGEMVNSSATFDHVNAPVLLVSHSGSKIDWRHSNTNNAKVQNFYAILSSYNEQIQNDPIIVCLCLDLDNDTIVGYSPSSVMRDQILKQIEEPEGRNPDIREFMQDAAIKPQGKRNLKAQMKYDKKLEEIDEWLIEHAQRCDCDCCELSKSYSQNVATEGPQKLVKIDLDTNEYLKFFNLYDVTNIENLKKVYELSIASLDIESYTREISRRSRLKRKLENISTIGRTTGVEGVQEVALIGYADDFTKDNMNHYHLFKVTNDDETKDVVSKMMDHIIERQNVMQKRKANLLAPLFSFINKFKEAHSTFWEEELQKKFDPAKVKEQIEDSFKNSLIGKFEKHLQNLQSRFAVYTFNGGKYDLVLLHKHIASYYKEKGQTKPLDLIKKDSRIQKMKLRSGIVFLDICDLIGPGNSLAKFSKLTGQEEVKMVFPFSCFTSIDFLNKTSLPSSMEAWFNDLKNEFTPEDEIKRAQDDFRKLGVQTVGEYLEAYLKSGLICYLWDYWDTNHLNFFQLMFVS